MNNKMWVAGFADFHDRFHGLFQRSDSREQSSKYLRGLLSTAERKNGWQIAEIAGNEVADPTQRLLYRTQWDQEAARDILQDYIIEKLGTADGVGILDETGFIKKGRASVGVQRQYTGTAGKIENCQIGVFLAYNTRHGHSLLDRRLYIPEVWCNDSVRRKRAKIPENIQFKTKPELAMEMLDYAFCRGVPMKWITGDEVYGNSSELREMLENRGKSYVLAIKSNMLIRADSDSKPVSAAMMAQNLRPDQWRRISVGHGEKGERLYDWAAQRILEKRKNTWQEGWFLIRRSIDEPGEMAYYLSNAAKDIRLKRLAVIAATRFRIEQCFEEAKGETGLDHYEARLWQCWYRHITLSMMAHAFLAVMRVKAGGKKNLHWKQLWQN